MAAKAASTSQRFALGLGALLFVLVGVVLGVLVLRSGTGSATRPTPAVTTSDAVGTAGPRSDDGDPVPIASTVSANSAEPVASASATPSPSSRATGSTGLNAPTTNGNGGPNNGASTNPQVNPARPVKPHGDEIRSPFE
jgi:cytoskeletal protein RodZ